MSSHAPILLMSPFGEMLHVRLFEVGGKPVTLAGLATSVTVIVGAYTLSRLVQSGIHRALSKRGVDEIAGVHLAERLLHYAFLLIGLAVALQTAGIEVGALFTAGAVVAVGIGIGLQNIAQNFVSGVILLVEHSIKPGDVLELEGYLVRVVEMGVRATWVRTRDDEVLIVPNATLVQSTVKSYTLIDPHFRVRVKVGVAYDSDMALVRKTLEEVARATQVKTALPEPLILLSDFGPSSVDWDVSIWTDDPWKQFPVASELREAIFRGLMKQGIRIAYPQLDLHADAPLLQALARKAA